MDKLVDVKNYIKAREPIFHHREFTNSKEDLEKEMTDDYFEISASGCDYSKEFVISYLEKRYKEQTIDDMVSENWKVKNFKIKKLADELYLVNYILDGQNRITKRGEIWKGNLTTGLKVMYHQGTIVIPSRVKEHKVIQKHLNIKNK